MSRRHPRGGSRMKIAVGIALYGIAIWLAVYTASLFIP